MHLTKTTLVRRERRLSRLSVLRRLAEGAGRCLDAAIEIPQGKSRFAAFFAFVFSLLCGPAPARAAGQDPAGVVGRTTDFLLNLLMGVGICFIAFGVLSLAISFQSHDDSQKSKAVMAIMGGAIAVSVRYVIQIVAPNAGISV